MPAWCAPLLIGHRGDLFARLLKRGAGNLFPGLLTVVEQLHPNKSERRINLTHPIEKRFGDCGIQKLPKKQLGLQSREGRRLHAIKNGVGRTNSASSGGDAALALPRLRSPWSRLRESTSLYIRACIGVEGTRKIR